MAHESPVRILPLGGIGEIGRNLLVIEYEDDVLFLDAGLMFPQYDMLGVDLVLPDISVLGDKLSRVKGIILTHGHEDHIGAIPFVLPKLPVVPIYGSPLTLGILTNKLKEHHLMDHVRLVPITCGEHYRAGVFDVEFIHTTHSIPDATAIAITTPRGIIVHTGDFKIDYTPVHGAPPDLARFSALGDKGVLCLLSDSTNAESPGTTPSERSVRPALEHLMADAPGRVLVATFASNLGRVQQTLDLTLQFNRRCLVVGRSMLNNIAVAKQHQLLTFPEDHFVPLKGYENVPAKELTILCTGSQGEPLSALSRIASERHPIVSPDPDDLVIISANPIPGNEQLVYRTINHLVDKGVTVATMPRHQVHASGHASQEELKLMLTLVRPKYFIPVHGEPRHLAAHAGIARVMGMSHDKVFVIRNGTAVDFFDASVRVKEHAVQAGYVYVDGVNIEESPEIILRDRNHLAQDGIIIVVMTIDRDTGELLGSVDIVSRGFVNSETWNDIADRAKASVERSITSLSGQSDRATLSNAVRDRLGQQISHLTHRRPMILPVITEV